MPVLLVTGSRPSPAPPDVPRLARRHRPGAPRVLLAFRADPHLEADRVAWTQAWAAISAFTVEGVNLWRMSGADPILPGRMRLADYAAVVILTQGLDLRQLRALDRGLATGLADDPGVRMIVSPSALGTDADAFPGLAAVTLREPPDLGGMKPRLAFARDVERALADAFPPPAAPASPPPPRAVILASHPPGLDPRLGWMAGSLQKEGYAVTVIGVRDGGASADGAQAVDEPGPRTVLVDRHSAGEPDPCAPDDPGSALVDYLNACARLDDSALAGRAGADWADEEALGRFRDYLLYVADGNRALTGAGAEAGPFDLVVSADLDTLPAGVALAGRSDAVLVYDAHECWPYSFLQFEPWECRFWTQVEGALLVHADIRITVSDPLADHLSAAHGLAFLSVPNAVPLDGAAPPRAAAGGRPNFLFLGNFAEGRSLDLLIAAWARARPPATLSLQGPDNPFKAGLRAQAQGREDIVFPPAVPAAELQGAAALADVGVVPYGGRHSINYRMCCPNKLSQYLAAGLPILANESDYVARIVRDAGLGRVVDFADPAALDRALAEMAADPAALRDMGRRARRFFETDFHWEAAVRPLMDALRLFQTVRRLPVPAGGGAHSIGRPCEDLAVVRRVDPIASTPPRRRLYSGGVRLTTAGPGEEAARLAIEAGLWADQVRGVRITVQNVAGDLHAAAFDAEGRRLATAALPRGAERTSVVLDVPPAPAFDVRILSGPADMESSADWMDCELLGPGLVRTHDLPAGGVRFSVEPGSPAFLPLDFSDLMVEEANFRVEMVLDDVEGELVAALFDAPDADPAVATTVAPTNRGMRRAAVALNVPRSGNWALALEAAGAGPARARLIEARIVGLSAAGAPRPLEAVAQLDPAGVEATESFQAQGAAVTADGGGWRVLAPPDPWNYAAWLKFAPPVPAPLRLKLIYARASGRLLASQYGEAADLISHEAALWASPGPAAAFIAIDAGASALLFRSGPDPSGARAQATLLGIQLLGRKPA